MDVVHPQLVCAVVQCPGPSPPLPAASGLCSRGAGHYRQQENALLWSAAPSCTASGRTAASVTDSRETTGVGGLDSLLYKLYLWNRIECDVIQSPAWRIEQPVGYSGVSVLPE